MAPHRMTPAEELEALVPPWELSEEAWMLLEQSNPEGYAAARFLLQRYNEEKKKEEEKKK